MANNDDEKRNQVREKIQQLLKLHSDPAATEGEATAAMRAIHQLCVRYNLELDEIQSNLDESGLIERVFEDNWTDSWVTTLWAASARLYFCESYIQRAGKVQNRRGGFSRGVRRIVVGQPHNVEIAFTMAQYLVNTVRSLGNRFHKKSQLERSSFWRGASHRLYERCVELMDEAQKDCNYTDVNTEDRLSVSSNIVLASMYEKMETLITEHMRNKGYKLKQSSKPRKSNDDVLAYFQGYNEGGNISLQPQLKNPD